MIVLSVLHDLGRFGVKDHARVLSFWPPSKPNRLHM